MDYYKEAETRQRDIAFYQATVNDPGFDQELNKRDFAAAFNKPDEIVKKAEDVEQVEGEEPPAPTPNAQTNQLDLIG